jgi:hypothetical protein
MNNLMSNFSGLALSRMEMKNVVGGCSAQTSSGGEVTGLSRQDAIAFANAAGTHYCCQSCDSASWHTR